MQLSFFLKKDLESILSRSIPRHYAKILLDGARFLAVSVGSNRSKHVSCMLASI